ncbi:MAG: hypothetical protein P8011_09815 [Acidihalobacter sp.]|uniref:hypothetical protein n=1 Tax=Acidihalobacter sp. TaxID=1872108 RepID=UPI00307ED4CB
MYSFSRSVPVEAKGGEHENPLPAARACGGGGRDRGMGGPMNIYEEDAYPWLIAEKRFIRQAI